MTPDELKQFGELAKKFEPADKDAVLKIVKDDIHPVFQDINDGGRTAANLANDTKTKALTKERDDALGKVTKAEKDLSDLNGQAPDAAKLRKKYEDDLTAARTDFDTKTVALKNQLKDTRKDNNLSKFVDILSDPAGDYQINREYAETILIKKPEVAGRVVVDDDGKLTVLKVGTTDIPLVPPSDGKKTLLHLLADDVAPTVEKTWKISGVKRGSNTKGSGGGDGDVSTDKKVFADIRTKTQAKEKAAVESKKGPSGYEKLRSGRR